MLTIFGWNFEIWAVQKYVHLVDFVKSSPLSGVPATPPAVTNDFSCFSRALTGPFRESAYVLRYLELERVTNLYRSDIIDSTCTICCISKSMPMSFQYRMIVRDRIPYRSNRTPCGRWGLEDGAGRNIQGKLRTATDSNSTKTSS